MIVRRSVLAGALALPAIATVAPLFAAA